MAMDTYEAGGVPFVLDGPRWTAVERLCARLGTTPYVAITSGFLLLLSRWSGRGDVCALSGNFHRNRPGSEAVIGDFVTPYPLRVAIDDHATLEDVVRHCHDAVLSHREHGQVAPSSALAAWPDWMRYNINYQISVGEVGALALDGVTVERLGWSAFARRTPHDLALFVREDARGVRGDLVYNAERFSPELAARAAARLDQLIDTLATASSHRAGALSRGP
jgi:non-ribosomal peptide synthetase component F